MAKSFLAALALVPMLARAAELSPGVVEVTGSSRFGLESSSSTFEGGSTTDRTTYGMDVTGVYYLTPNVGLGLRLGYSSQKTTTGSATDTVRGVMVGPAIALELPLQEKLSIAALGSIAYTFAKFSTDPLKPDTTASGWDLQLGAGLKYYVVPAFSLSAGVGYHRTELEYSAGSGSSVTGTASGLGVNAGFSVYFGR